MNFTLKMFPCCQQTSSGHLIVEETTVCSKAVLPNKNPVLLGESSFSDAKVPVSMFDDASTRGNVPEVLPTRTAAVEESCQDSTQPEACAVEEPCQKLTQPEAPTEHTLPIDSRDSPHVNVEHPLAVAARLGRYAAALRELSEYERSGGNPRSILDEASIERVRRIGDKFDVALKVLQTRPDELKLSETNTELELKWGIQVEGDRMKVVTVAEYKDLDFVRMLAVDLARDFEDQTSDDDIKQTIVGSALVHEAVWHKLASVKSVKSTTDDVFIVSSVDALDEPLRSVCSLKYTLGDAPSTPSGVAVPAPERGRERSPYTFIASAFEPLRTDGRVCQGVRKIEVSEVQLPFAIAQTLSITPAWVLKRMMRENAENAVKMTRKFFSTRGGQVDALVAAPPREEFLTEVRCHLYDEQLA